MKRKSSSEAKTRASFGDSSKAKSISSQSEIVSSPAPKLESQMIYLFVARDSDMIVYETHIEK